MVVVQFTILVITLRRKSAFASTQRCYMCNKQPIITYRQKPSAISIRTRFYFIHHIRQTTGKGLSYILTKMWQRFLQWLECTRFIAGCRRLDKLRKLRGINLEIIYGESGLCLDEATVCSVQHWKGYGSFYVNGIILNILFYTNVLIRHH